MMKKVLIICGILLALNAKAQQVYLFSNHMNNQYLLNPAASGLYNYLEWNAGLRRQWTGIDGAPTSYYTSLNVALNKQKNRRFRTKEAKRLYYLQNKHQLHHGLGLLVSKDEFGAFQKTRFQASYGVHVPIWGPYRLAVAPRFGVGNTALDPSKVSLKDAADPTYAFYLAENNQNLAFDMDVGIWFYSDKLFFGYSALQIVPNGYTPADVSKDGRQLAHHHVTSGYHFIVKEARDYDDLESRNIVVTPSTMFRYKYQTPLNVDLSVNVRFEQLGNVGFSYRVNNAMAFWVGFEIGHKMRLSYAYDVPTTALQGFQTGSHEFSLTVNMLKDRFSTRSTRY